MNKHIKRGKFGEKNLQTKKWKSQFKIALVYPNQYSVMAGLTVQTLYSLFNSYTNVVCERFFLPSPELYDYAYPPFESRLKNPRLFTDSHQNIHWGRAYAPLRSLESNIELKHFDCIAFTISYELDYPNMLWVLDNAQIPLSAKEREQRQEQGDYPIVIGGGPALRSNALPVLSFLDLVFLGEIEPEFGNFLEIWNQSRENPSISLEFERKKYFLQEIARLPGVITSQDHPISNLDDSDLDLKLKPKPNSNPHPESTGFAGYRVHPSNFQKVYVQNLDDLIHPTSQILPQFDAENPLPFGDSFFLEVNRGCPHVCRFCITGSQVKPFRNRSLEKLKEIVLEGIHQTSTNKVVLIGSSVTDHPQIEELCEFLLEQNLEFSIPSIRIDRLSTHMADILGKSGMHTVSIAPESGSERLRFAVINKHISNQSILKGVQLLHAAGIPNIKLYLLYGLPSETKSDLDAICDLARSIAGLGFDRDGVRLSINPFIPKANTTFQTQVDLFMEPKLATLREKFQILERNLKGNIQIKIDTLSLEEAFIQVLFSLGDQKFAEYIKMCYFLGTSIKKWYKTFQKPPLHSEIIQHLNRIKQSQFMDLPWGMDYCLPKNYLQHDYQKLQKDLKKEN